jgi:hypothetical protein
MTPPTNPSPHDLPGDIAEEWQSAWYDRELSASESAAVGTASLREPTAERQQDYQRLSHLLQSLPFEGLPPDFASRVISRLPHEPLAVPLPTAEPKAQGWAGLPQRHLGWLAASLVGLGTLVTLWRPAVSTNSQGSRSPREATDQSLEIIANSQTPSGLEARPSLAAQLQEISADDLVYVRIRVPRGPRSPDGIAAIDLTEEAFGENFITQVSETQGVADSAPAPPGPAPAGDAAAGFGRRTMAGPEDPMLLLVVGESEAIVHSLEQLLRNLEQTELEDEIRAVAQTELDELARQLNHSLVQSLADLEQSWSPAPLAASETADRRLARVAKQNAPAALLPERGSEGQLRSRGSMAWLPPDAPAAARFTAGATRPNAPTLEQVSEPDSERSAALPEQPALAQTAPAALGRRAKAQSKEPRAESAPAQAIAAPAIAPEPDTAEGRRPRRVLIQLIPDPAG